MLQLAQLPVRRRWRWRLPRRRNGVCAGSWGTTLIVLLCLTRDVCKLDSYCLLCKAFISSYPPFIKSRLRLSVHWETVTGQRLRPRGLFVVTSGSGSAPTNSIINNTETSMTQTASTPTFFYSSSQLQQIKDSINIVDVIEHYRLNEFKRLSQDRATAVCPFHDDHNPSLSVDNGRQIYKCFACGAGGDVFHFVRHYSSEVQGQDMTFGQAVKHVLKEFGDGSSSALATGSAGPTEPPRARHLTLEEQQQQNFLRNRILSANAAAAAYYAEQLIQPTAGGARQYLLERYLTPATVKTFGLGYAPDVYFGDDATRGKSSSAAATSAWGQGSLARHLQSLNFTANEVVQAGLALPTQRAQQQQQQKQKMALPSSFKNATSSSSSTTATNWMFTDIMDRFRGRLVVPILDATGRHILGFGGRLLPGKKNADRMVGEDDLEDKHSSPYQPPKYLNSPESIVFEKKSVLFGHHVARRAMQTSSTETVPLVVVEGYMDVISLWTVGVETGVATMGTAVSKEQLQAAANLAAERIVLCFDSDTAGEAAVERLCTNGFLRDLLLHHKQIQVYVATLSVGVKDPAGYIEFCRRNGSDSLQVAKNFRTDVLDTAVDWTDWFLHRILRRYDPGAPRGANGSFGNIFEQVADFMAGSMSAVDRTQRALDVASLLAGVLAAERNTTDISKAVRTQLESDLLDLSSRMANAKESLERRTNTFGYGSSNLLATLARGSGPESIMDETTSKLARNVTMESEHVNTMTYDTAKLDKETPRGRAFRPRERRRPKSLTPHFAGFKFAHDTDAAWLGINNRKRTAESLVLGLLPRKYRPSEEDLDYSNDPTVLLEKAVYFASNQYHGSHFLTDEAATAGYSQLNVRFDPAFVEKGVGILLQQDVQLILAASENMLLRSLIHNSSARTYVRNSLDARKAIHSNVLLRFSHPSREWLFRLLTQSRIPSDAQSPEALREFISSLDDCPDGAFCSPGSPSDETSNYIVSSLEPFFLEQTNLPLENDGHERAELQAQESLSNLMWASSAHKLQHLQQQLVSLEQDIVVFSSDLEVQSDQPDTAASILDAPKLAGSSYEIESKTVEKASRDVLVEELNEVTRSLKSLTASSKRIQGQLLDQTAPLGLEGHLSTALQKRLAAELDDHLSSVLSQSSTACDVFEGIEVGDVEDEPYKDALERMASEWGDWYDEDYYWSLEDAHHRPVPMRENIVLNDGEDEENLEDALARMDREWAGWDGQAG